MGATMEVITPSGELAEGYDAGQFDGQYRTEPKTEPVVEKGSSKVNNDASAIKNRIQVFSPTPTPREEPVPTPFRLCPICQRLEREGNCRVS